MSRESRVLKKVLRYLIGPGLYRWSFGVGVASLLTDEATGEIYLWATVKDSLDVGIEVFHDDEQWWASVQTKENDVWSTRADGAILPLDLPLKASAEQITNTVYYFLMSLNVASKNFVAANENDNGTPQSGDIKAQVSGDFILARETVDALVAGVNEEFEQSQLLISLENRSSSLEPWSPRLQAEVDNHHEFVFFVREGLWEINDTLRNRTYESNFCDDVDPAGFALMFADYLFRWSGSILKNESVDEGTRELHTEYIRKPALYFIHAMADRIGINPYAEEARRIIQGYSK